MTDSTNDATVAEALDGLGDRLTPAVLAEGLPEVLEALRDDPEKLSALRGAFMAAEPLADRLREYGVEYTHVALRRDVDVTLEALAEAGHLPAGTLDHLAVAPSKVRLRAALIYVERAREADQAPPVPRNHHRNPWWCFSWDALLERDEDLHAEPFAVS